MPAPFQSTTPQAIKIENEGSSAPHTEGPSDQELTDMFRKDVQRWLELRKKQGQYRTSGSVDPAPPLPVHQPPPPPPAPPSAAQAHHTWAKRPAAGPPPGFHGVRQPPQKQYQRKPLWERAPPPAPHGHHPHSGPSLVHVQPHAPQPATNGHRAPGHCCPPPPPVHGQHAPQPAPNGHRGPPPVRVQQHAPPPVHGSSDTPPPPTNTNPPPPQRRSAPTTEPPIRGGAAAKNMPTVPCVFCGVLCMTAWHLKQHEQGRKHRNKMAYLAGEMNVRCDVCNVHLSSGVNVEQHYAGKQHLRRLHGGA